MYDFDDFNHNRSILFFSVIQVGCVYTNRYVCMCMYICTYPIPTNPSPNHRTDWHISALRCFGWGDGKLRHTHTLTYITTCICAHIHKQYQLGISYRFIILITCSQILSRVNSRGYTSRRFDWRTRSVQRFCGIVLLNTTESANFLFFNLLWVNMDWHFITLSLIQIILYRVLTK